MDYTVDSSNRSAQSAPTPLRMGGEDATTPTTDFHLAHDAAITTTTTTSPHNLDPNHHQGEQDEFLWWDDDDESSTEGIDVLGAESHNSSTDNFHQWSRSKIGWLVTNRTFKRTVLLSIMINSLALVLRTWLLQRRVNDGYEQEQPLPMMIETICRAIVRTCQVAFSIELLLEVAHFQLRTLTRAWIVIDLVVVLLSWCTGSTTVLIFRTFRLLRALRKASKVRVIRTTVKAFLKALPHLMALAVVFTLFLFMFAVLFTDFYLNHLPEDYEENSYTFANMRNSAMTLFEIMTGGRLWGDIANEFGDAHPAGPWMLIFFVGTAIFAFGGMAVAIMVHGLMVAISGPDAAWTWSNNNVASHHYNNKNSKLAASPWTGSPKSLDAGTAATASMYTFHEASFLTKQPGDASILYRLEQRMDGLSRNVEHILGMQVSLAESISQLQKKSRTEQLQQQQQQVIAAPSPRKDSAGL